MTGTNARPSVAPTWGVEGMFGTNPLTLGVPTDEPFNFNFDAATSVTQNGKVEYFARIGADVKPGTIIGDDGQCVTGDAAQALRRIRQGTAALTTVGGIGEDTAGYKGYGFALFVELMCAALQDGYYGKALNGVDENGRRCAPRLGHFFIAIDTDHFLGEELCRRKSGEILRSVRASKRMPGAERIYTAGEKEYETKMARTDGVPINDSVQGELNEIRAQLGLTDKYRFPWD
jgi:LDH2 family malate/lactate/ureidoglycolate dehydrogenase